MKGRTLRHHRHLSWQTLKLLGCGSVWRRSGFLIASLFGICVALSGCQQTIDESPQTTQSRPQHPPRTAQAAPTTTPKDSITAILPPDARLIAVLLPLSGPHKELGQALLRASNLALEHAKDSRMILLPVDTGDPQNLTPAALTALGHRGIAIAVGPVFSTDIAKISTLRHHFTLLSLSNDGAAAGNGVFVAGYRPDDQIDALLTYAQSQHTLRHAAVLLPNTPHGHALDGIIQRAFMKHGLALAFKAFYSPQHPETLSAGQALNGRPHDALLIPEGGRSLPTLIQSLVQDGYNTQAVPVLGMDGWHTTDLRATPNIHGALFSALPRHHRHVFEKAYESVFQASALPLCALSYDLTTLAIHLAGSAPLGAPVTPERVMHHDGFTGVTGLFRFNANGTNQRSYDIIRVTAAGNVTVSPAAKTFSNP